MRERWSWRCPFLFNPRNGRGAVRGVAVHNYGTALRRRCAQIRPLTRATQMGVDLHSRCVSPDSLQLKRPREGNRFPRSFIVSQSRRVVRGLSKSSARICVRRARSAPRISAHLRRSAFPLLLLGPNEDHGGIFAPGRETRNGNSQLTTASARHEHRFARQGYYRPFCFQFKTKSLC